MSTRIIILSALASISTGCTTGCTTDPGTRPASANWEDAGPPSTSVALESVEPYPACTWADIAECPPSSPRDHRAAYSFGPERGCWRACQCRNECEVSDDCPTPESGTVRARCFHGMCVLQCSDAETCPTGMECVHEASRDVSWCMWVSEVACEEG